MHERGAHQTSVCNNGAGPRVRACVERAEARVYRHFNMSPQRPRQWENQFNQSTLLIKSMIISSLQCHRNNKKHNLGPKKPN